MCFSRGHDQFLGKFMIKPTVHAIQRGSPLCFLCYRSHEGASGYIPIHPSCASRQVIKEIPKVMEVQLWVQMQHLSRSMRFCIQFTPQVIICPAPKNRSIRCKRLSRTCKKWTGQVAPNPSEIMKGWLSENKGVESGRLLRIQRDTWRSKRLVDRHGRPRGFLKWDPKNPINFPYFPTKMTSLTRTTWGTTCQVQTFLPCREDPLKRFLDLKSWQCVEERW